MNTGKLAELKNIFRRTFGGEPAYYVRAPGRVNLIGEHIDYNGGYVLPIAIDKEIRLLVRPRRDGRFHLKSLQMEESYKGPLPDRPLSEPQWVNYVFGLVHEFRNKGEDVPGLEALYDASLPLASGLGSSGALEVAMAWFIRELLLTGLTRLQIAVLCQQGDNNFVGVRCGLMDQAISACAEKGKALLLDCAVPGAETVAVGFSDRTEFLIAHSGLSRKLALSSYNERRRQCEEALALINDAGGGNYNNLCSVPADVLNKAQNRLSPVLRRRARHVVSEQQRVIQALDALKRADAERFGELLNLSHKSLAEDYEVSCPELEELTGWLRSQKGVLGSRLTGAGFGGCTVSLVKKANAKEILTKLKSEFYAPRGIGALAFFSPAEAGVSCERI